MSAIADSHYPLFRFAGLLRSHLFRDPELPFASKLRLYLLNIGFRRPAEAKQLRALLDGMAATSMEGPFEGGIFDQNNMLREDVLARFGLSTASFYAEPLEDHRRVTLRDISENEFFDPNFPDPLQIAGRSIRRITAVARRPALDMLDSPGAVLFADPTWQLVFSPDARSFYPSSGPLALTRSVLQVKEVVVPEDIVVIGDRFPARNICHFTLCWLNRVAIFCEAKPGRAKAARFIGPMVLNRFTDFVLGAVCEAYGLSKDQFVFPAQATRYRAGGTVYWFSDSGMKANLHPAHKLHPASVQHLMRLGASARVVAKRAGHSEGARRLYVTRADAKARRVANEDEVWSLLSGRGFSRVALSALSPAEQVAAMTAADIIVAPHGAGLTHLAFTAR